MKVYRSIIGCFALAAIALFAASAKAQDPVTTGIAAANIAAPIVAHTIKPAKTSTSGKWMKAEILHADQNSMVVSEQGNERMIHTFTYNDTVKTKMAKIIDKGGYQYGDKINVQYTPGSTVAVKIKGKPSKSS
jgi:hypothetical protein